LDFFKYPAAPGSRAILTWSVSAGFTCYYLQTISPILVIEYQYLPWHNISKIVTLKYMYLFYNPFQSGRDNRMRKELTEKIKRAVLELEPSAEIILYGSRARNDYREYSDWDFLVLVDGPVDNNRADQIRRALFEIELDTDQVISSIIRDRNEWNSMRYSVVPLRINIEQEGIHL
jgi:uncharacterized protein